MPVREFILAHVLVDFVRESHVSPYLRCGLFVDDNDMLYPIDSESDENHNSGRWRKGLRIGSARKGEVLYFIREHVSERASGMGGVGSMGEGVTVDAAGNIIAGEVGPSRASRSSYRACSLASSPW